VGELLVFDRTHQFDRGGIEPLPPELPDLRHAEAQRKDDRQVADDLRELRQCSEVHGAVSTRRCCSGYAQPGSVPAFHRATHAASVPLPRLPPRETAMSADTKTPLDHVNDTILQLKEMRHYSKNNVELLTTQWLLFDGELSKLKQAEKVENLMTRQGEFHDALEALITDMKRWRCSCSPRPRRPRKASGRALPQTISAKRPAPIRSSSTASSIGTPT
jgi:hypothetical protein